MARLHSDGRFAAYKAESFKGGRAKVWLAPPLLARKGPDGRPKKMAFPGWTLDVAFPVLTKLKGMRGTPLDVFGYTAERRMERQLIADYERTVGGLLDTLDGGNVDLAAEIASIPEHIRGFGHVKEAHLHAAKAREAELLREWNNPLRVVQVQAA